MSILSDLPRNMQLDLNDLFVGDLIDYGVYRKVYHSNQDSTVVIKMETAKTTHFANVCEWTMWTQFQGTKWEKWLAPCIMISQSGTILIQKKTTPIEGSMPKMVPNFFLDLKRSNWGIFEDHPVMHDYGHSHLFDIAKTKYKMIPYKKINAGRCR